MGLTRDCSNNILSSGEWGRKLAYSLIAKSENMLLKSFENALYHCYASPLSKLWYKLLYHTLISEYGSCSYRSPKWPTPKHAQIFKVWLDYLDMHFACKIMMCFDIKQQKSLLAKRKV